MLRLLDTLAHLLSPLTAAIDQEFGGRSIAPQQPAEPPAPQPRPTPLPEPETQPQPAVSPPAEADRSASDAEFSPAVGDDVPVAEPVIVTSAPAAAEPLYVRRGEGRGARYLLASDAQPGDRWRRVVRGGRAKYERAGGPTR